MRVFLLTLIIMSGCTHNPMPSFNATAATCYDEHNKPIAIIDNYNANNVLDLASARYNIKKQRREIRLSNDIKQVSTPVLEFAFYHECAHHQLNHIKVSQIPQMRNMWGDKEKQEEKM